MASKEYNTPSAAHFKNILREYPLVSHAWVCHYLRISSKMVVVVSHTNYLLEAPFLTEKPRLRSLPLQSIENQR